MIIGPSLPSLKESAKAAIARFFVDVAEGDGTPATLRAMYVLKSQQAEVWLNTGASLDNMIEREAELRGLEPRAMALLIKQMAADSINMEMARTRANVSIEAANDAPAVMAILADYGVTIGMAATEMAPGKPLID